MRLDRIEIEAFRGIDRLSVDLVDLTAIIGEPDCGKSSLLRAIATVLGPHEAGALPAIRTTDFHRPTEDEASRATTLSIALDLRLGAGDEDLAGLAGTQRGDKDGDIRLLVRARRSEAEEPSTTLDVLDRTGAPLAGVDAQALLDRLRRRHPAVVVGGARRSAEGGDRASSRLGSFLRGKARPDEPLGWDELAEVREEILQVGGRLAEQLGPAPERRRSVLAMTDTPRALVTDLAEALSPGAGRQRRIAALWFLIAYFDAMPEGGLGPEAEPILLLDDIEANLHPTWLAAVASVAFNLPFQQIVATHSPEVLTWIPLSSLRRLRRGPAGLESRSVHPERYSLGELRRLTFHVRLNRGGSFFARCWVLVEGETEAWLVPEFARIVGVELPVEGIRVIEFAQCGIEALMKLADDLGIAWVALADGDPAGRNYARRVEAHLDAQPSEGEVVVLPALDIEGYLYRTGYAEVIGRAAGIGRSNSTGRVIRAAVEQVTKPGLALMVLEEADARGPESVPPVLRDLAESALRLARA